MSRYCISCGEIISEEGIMHEKCIRKVFSSSQLPTVPFSIRNISQKAQEYAGKLSISGVQPKLSVRINRKTAEIITVGKEGQFILKPQTDRFLNLPENENMCMTIFAIAGIETALHGIIDMHDGSHAYIVRRFDRKGKEKIHFEDFQSVIQSSDKYDGSMEKIGNAIRKYAKFPGIEVQKFFKIAIMNFIVGNGDAHLKNYGFLYDNDDLNLSPCYDIVSSKLVIQNEVDSALTINGKKNKLYAEDFMKFSEYLKIDETVALGIIKDLYSAKDKIIEFVANYPFLLDMKKDFIEILKDGWSRVAK